MDLKQAGSIEENQETASENFIVVKNGSLSREFNCRFTILC